MAQAAEVSPLVHTQTQASPERWQRVLFAGVAAKQLAGSGEWIVSSASRPGLAYQTDGISCDCEAAMLGGDPVCLHRAAYWYAQAVLERDPEPEPPVSVAPLVLLGGWSFADEAPEDDAVGVACTGCGDHILTEDPDEDAYCAACSMPIDEVAALRMVSAPAACLLCGAPIYRGDADDAGTRHARCGRLLTSLDARCLPRKEVQPIAA